MVQPLGYKFAPQLVLPVVLDRAAGMVRTFLLQLPPGIIETRWNHDLFTIPEQVVHLLQVMEFTMQAMRSRLSDEELELPRPLAKIATTEDPEEAHAALSRMNLRAARAEAERFTSLQALIWRWDEVTGKISQEIAALTDEQFGTPMVHPMTPHISGNCYTFLLEMLVAHTRHHLGQMTLQWKYAGHTVPSPLDALTPSRPSERTVQS